MINLPEECAISLFHRSRDTTAHRDWKGLRHYKDVFRKTLFVIASDHGHTPVNWQTAVGLVELQKIFENLHRPGGQRYHLDVPSRLVTHRADGDIVTVLNGGSLGIYVKAGSGGWERNPNFDTDLFPILSRLLPRLEKLNKAPSEVFYRSGNEYLHLKYTIRGDRVVDEKSLTLDTSPLLNLPLQYPDARRRLLGMVDYPHSLLERRSGPDVILLADRRRGMTFANEQDPEFRPSKDGPTGRQIQSDHGHLGAEDSIVPIIFSIGAFADRPPDAAGLQTLCEGSVVDIAPTILDLLGVYGTPLFDGKSYEEFLKSRYANYMGRSLKPLLEAILRNDATDGLCRPTVFNPYLIDIDEPDESNRTVDFEVDKDVADLVREQQALMAMKPEMIQYGHLIERSVTYVLVGGRVHILDRLRGERAKGERPQKELWMQLLPESGEMAAALFDYRTAHRIQLDPVKWQRTTFYRTPIGDQFDVVEITSAAPGTQCPSGRAEDTLGVMSRARYPNGLTLNLVYDKQPRSASLYSFTTEKLTEKLTAVKLMATGEPIDDNELGKLRGDLARFKAKGVLRGLDIRTITHGEAFKVPERFLVPVGRQVFIQHSCSFAD